MMRLSLFKSAGDLHGPGIKGGRACSGPNDDDARTVYGFQSFCGLMCDHGSEIYHSTHWGRISTKQK
jgi:hypothetical protein